MIIFDLKCSPQVHVFEAWFASSAAFEEQLARGLVACPLCGSKEVAKAPMAPGLNARSEARSSPFASEASRAEAESLIEEGVPIAPLPFPLVPPGEEN